MVLAATAAVTGCTADPKRADPTGVPPGLDAFYAQSVDWVPCGSGHTEGWFAEPLTGRQCAQVRAPLDYRAARGRSIHEVETVLLAVSRRLATGAKRGALIAISGGPGGTGLELVDWPYPREVLAGFDIISYDPRGVGRSTPSIRCAGAVDSDIDLDDTEATEAAERAEVAACVRDTGLEVLRHIGSDEATNDVDLLRGVLGEERINLLAYSYGTQIAAMYALRFPGNYRAAVLDGVVDLAERPHEMFLGQVRGYQATFDRLAAFCTGEYRQRGLDCPLGADPATAESAFHALLREVDADPVPVSEGEDVTASTVLQATYTGLLWRSSWEDYLEALNELRDGDATTIRRLADFQDSGGDNAITAITCTDIADPTTDRAARHHEAAALYDAATFDDYDTRPAQFPLMDCDLWPFPGQVVPGKILPVTPARSPAAPRLLFVGTRHDPTTPIGNAERMARYLTSPLLIREADGHTFVFSDENDCGDDEVVRYLLDPASGRDWVCS
ncbi:alpha/beta fold hydrolase [Nocardia sp. NPDC048505]|uniref:alpha/beta fold hydrolase n=1 Tax=unclassified Nocardia TaxID=2637762 RepID=UPI0034045FCE